MGLCFRCFLLIYYFNQFEPKLDPQCLAALPVGRNCLIRIINPRPKFVLVRNEQVNRALAFVTRVYGCA